MNETTSTARQGAISYAIPQLTAGFLATKIAGNERLSQFLSKKCGQVSSATLKIYSTAHMGYFTFLEENRPLNEAHVLSLMDSFVKDGYLFTIVYVNELLQVIDGQHRYEAARRLGLPISFMVMPGWGIREVTVLNVNSRNWTLYDFLVSYTRSGNPNYARFKQFCDQHAFELTTSQLIVTGKRAGRRSPNDSFRSGKLVVSEAQLSDAVSTAGKIADMQLFHPLGWKSRNFVEAMLTLFALKEYSHEGMLERLAAHPDLLLAKARSLRVDEYLKIFVEKYNYRRTHGQISVSRL